MKLDRLLNRRDEMSALLAEWEAAERGPRLAVVWGRRRVGKTFLLLHLLERLPGRPRRLFHAATQQSETVELARLHGAVHEQLGAEVADLAGGGFSSWERALRFLVAVGRQEPLVVVLDEVPYLTRSTPGFASIVQAVWDSVSATSPAPHLLLALTGSAVGTMEDVLGPAGALHRRASLELRIDPFDLQGSAEALASMEPESLVEAYAACGGYPLHLRAWRQDASTDENLAELAGRPGGLLLEGARSVLREELGGPDGYQRVLAAVGRGRTRWSEIATDAEQRIERPLEGLLGSGLLRRSTPLGAPARTAPLYELADPYLRFWFAVLYADAALIEGGQGRQVLARAAGRWSAHLGWVFEESVRHHAQRLAADGRLPGDLVTGRWWTTSGPPAEIDVLGLRGRRTALAGEAKWRAAPLGLRDLADLRRAAERAPDPVEELILTLWGRGGVEPDVRRAGALGFDVGDVVNG